MAAIVELSTVTLVALARKGDNAAWDQLYRRYGHRVRTYAVHRCNGNWHEADDVASEAWVKALTRVEAWQPRGRDDDDFLRWLFGLVRGALGAARQAGYEQSPADFSYGSIVEVEWLKADDPDDSADELDECGTKQEMIEQLHTELRRMLPVHRTVVRMKLDGADNREISRETGLSTAQIAGTWTRAKATLRRKLVGGIDVTALSDAERAEWLALAEQLPDVSRTVAQLRLTGLSNQEVGDRAGMTRAQATGVWRHAEDLLRKLKDDPHLARQPQGRTAVWEKERDRLREALPTLSPTLRPVAAMRLDGKTHTQIAQELGRPVGSIGSSWRRALDSYTRSGLLPRAA
jgi:RNA polymerase sigma factor (sigma-70 family)